MPRRWLLLLLSAFALAAQSIPVRLGQPILLLPPTLDRAGQKVVFGSAIAADGTIFTTTDLYAINADGTGLRRLTQLAASPPPIPPHGVTAVSLSPDAARAAFTVFLAPSASGGEQVHVLDVSTATDRTVAVDTAGCIQPLAVCANCFFSCLNSVHITADGSKVLYAASRQQPFYVVNADGSGLTRLPEFSGSLAPAPQRVISRAGQVVFTSSAPSGPTFAAQATNVYLMNLDGSNLQQVTRFGSDPSVFCSNAAISADGSTIAFQSNRDPDTGAPSQVSRIYVVHADGSGLRAPFESGYPITAPSISGDGSIVVFGAGGQIYAVRADGTAPKTLVSSLTSAWQEPVVSEDGSRVSLMLGPQDGGRGAIYAINSDGSSLHAVYAPHALNPGGVTGAISFSAPSPGSLITAYGVNLAPGGGATAASFPLPPSLAGVSLLLNGIPVPLLAVTNWQVNAQLPPATPPGPAAFQLRFADGSMPPAVAADVQSVAPAIFSVVSTVGQRVVCQAA
ncbi:MAG TPA: LpqB family beta-propeller domain-containing protein, partial [Bryobacterales bacterium]|nr:LpqB family beta-propeller domain-containing protein [Bryobacterales bacterium]